MIILIIKIRYIRGVLLLKSLKIEEIIGIILKKWWVIVISFLLCGVLSYTYTTLFISPVYISRGSLYINNKSNITQNPNIYINNITANDLTVALKLVDTYSVILKSNRFMEIVSEKVNLPYTFNQIKDMVSFKGVNETEVLSLSVEADNPDHANKIAQAILENSKSEITRVVEAGSVKIIDDASMPVSPSSPNKKGNTLIGMILGLVISVGILLLIKILDISVKDEEDLQVHYNIPVVGSIPTLSQINSPTNNALNKGAIDDAKNK